MREAYRVGNDCEWVYVLVEPEHGRDAAVLCWLDYYANTVIGEDASKHLKDCIRYQDFPRAEREPRLDGEALSYRRISELGLCEEVDSPIWQGTDVDEEVLILFLTSEV